MDIFYQRHMKTAKAIACMLLAFNILLMPLSLPAGAAQPGGSITQNIMVPLRDPTTGVAVGNFTGALTITRFVVQNGAVAAVGTLTGIATTPTGTVPLNNLPVTIPITTLQANCDILTLVLGPLHLDLLGLVIDLSQVVLTINAEQGPGNLLGNLLCTIAGLLDSPGQGPGLLQAIANLLNQILRAL